MKPMPIRIEQIDSVTIAHLDGQTLDASNAREFKSEIAPSISANARLVLDLSQLKFIDSSGLGALLSCLRQLNAIGGELKLYGMIKPVRALFELVRMHRVFEIFNTREEAFRSYGLSLASPVEIEK
jgi:anti-sigma B factor antagonist